MEKIRYAGSWAPVERLSVKGLLPGTENYMTYDGSLTQPPCHETVTWVVVNKPIYITKQQVREWGWGMGDSRVWVEKKKGRGGRNEGENVGNGEQANIHHHQLVRKWDWGIGGSREWVQGKEGGGSDDEKNM